MKITFLGTGTSQGVPVIGSQHPVCLSPDKKDKRLRASILIEWDDYVYVIDCGPDFRYQMLRAQCSKIDGVLFTHEHSDHVLGFDDIRPFYFSQGNIPIYAHKRVLKALKKRFDYIFKSNNKYPGVLTVVPHRIKNKPFSLHSMEVIPIKGSHGNLQIFGFRFCDFAYLTDMKKVKKKEIKKLKNLKVLVVNALRVAPHYSHFNLDEALEFIAKVKPEKAYLTHVSHLLGFHEVVSKSLPDHVFLAHDELEISL